MSFPKVLYILGDARSGSTLLSACLACGLAASHGGELKNAPERAWTAPEICSCGKPGTECPRWQEIRADFARRAGGCEAVVEFARLQARFDRLRGLPRALAWRLLRPARFRRYRELNLAFLASLAATVPSGIVIDNSKTPLRAFWLLGQQGIDLRLIHVVRDPRGAVWSQSQAWRRDLAAGINRDRAPVPLLKACLTWLFNNLAAGALGRLRRASYQVVCHENFVADPAATLARCVTRAGFDPTVLRPFDGPLDLAAQHIISGNALRMGGTVTVREGSGWRGRLDPWRAARTWRLTGWLARSYGYVREDAAS